MKGMAAAGLGDDLLLANERSTSGGSRPWSRAAAHESPSPSTPTRRSPRRRRPASPEVLLDVNVGLPRCGCEPEDARRLADLARSQGLEVRGVMGYEGHLMREPGDTKADQVERAMGVLLEAAERWAATSCPGAARAPGTSTAGSPSCRPGRTA